MLNLGYDKFDVEGNAKRAINDAPFRMMLNDAADKGYPKEQEALDRMHETLLEMLAEMRKGATPLAQKD